MIRTNVKLDLSKAENLKRSLINKVIRKAVTKNATPVLRAIKANVASMKRTGFMAKSLAKKVKTYGQSVVAIIGPRSQYSVSIGNYTRGKKIGQQRLYRPSKIWHLIERGTKRFAGRFPIQKAKDATQQTFASQVIEDVRQGIEELTR